MSSLENGICCICGKPYKRIGSNAFPIEMGRCCDECDNKIVIPTRKRLRKKHHSWYEFYNKNHKKGVDSNGRYL